MPTSQNLQINPQIFYFIHRFFKVIHRGKKNALSLNFLIDKNLEWANIIIMKTFKTIVLIYLVMAGIGLVFYYLLGVPDFPDFVDKVWQLRG